jgi:hypothetical protein
MLYKLNTLDIKLTPLAQTGMTRYFNHKYSYLFKSLSDKRWAKEDIMGFSNNNLNELYHFFAFMLGELIYIESERGINTSYDYFDNKYNFDVIRNTLACYNIELTQVFMAFALFSDEVIYPTDTIDGIYCYPFIKGGNLISYTIKQPLTAGENLIVHNKEGIVVSMSVQIGENPVQMLGWSIDSPLVTDDTRQVMVKSPADFPIVSIIMIIDLNHTP